MRDKKTKGKTKVSRRKEPQSRPEFVSRHCYKVSRRQEESSVCFLGKVGSMSTNGLLTEFCVVCVVNCYWMLGEARNTDQPPISFQSQHFPTSNSLLKQPPRTRNQNILQPESLPNNEMNTSRFHQAPSASSTSGNFSSLCFALSASLSSHVYKPSPLFSPKSPRSTYVFFSHSSGFSPDFAISGLCSI